MDERLAELEKKLKEMTFFSCCNFILFRCCIWIYFQKIESDTR